MVIGKQIVSVLRNLKWRHQNLGVQKTAFGSRVKVKSFMDHLVFKEIFTDGIYDEFIFKTLEKTNGEAQARTVWDLGANLGYFTIRCCEIWNQLGRKSPLHFVMFEPSETCSGRLEENIKAFNQKPFSFEIHNVLVGKKSGWDWFIEDEEHHLGQCVSEQIEKKGKRYTRKVSYRDLSQDLRSSRIDLLKCDIEGSEVDFIKSYKHLLDNIASIIIETHGERSKGFVKDSLKKIGFENRPSAQEDEESDFSNLFFSNVKGGVACQ